LLEAKQKIESYCAYQERCDFEVRKKLHSWNMFSEDIDILISDLISNNFLNEERFAEAFSTGKFRLKKWGKVKIKQHLKQKRISDYSINKGLSEIDETEYLEALRSLAEKKFTDSKGANQWEKLSKVKRFLYNKGYESELIAEILKEVGQD
jgi:regulatory protein